MTPADPSPPPFPDPAPPVQDTAQRLLPLAVALSAAAAVAIAGVSVYRSGFADSRNVQLGTLLVVLAAIWLPMAALAWRTTDTRRALALGIATAVGVWLPAAGMVAGAWTLLLCGALLLAALVACRHLWAGMGGARAVASALALGLVSGVALVLAGSAGRYQIPEAVRLGLAHSDQYFHLAIAQMISHFGVPSIGGDGLLLQRYHFGSHLVAAGLSRATHSELALVYVYWGGLALKLQLLWALVCATAWFSRRMPGGLAVSAVALHVLVYGFIGSAFLESESFLVALAVFLGSAPLIAGLLAGGGASGRVDRASLAWLVALTFLCAVAKISVGFYVAVVLAWVGWRHALSVLQRLGIVLALLLLLGTTWRFLRPDELSLLDAGLNPLYYSYLQYMNLSTLLTFAVPVIVLAWTVLDIRWSSGPGTGGTVDLRLGYRPAGHVATAIHRFLAADGLDQLLGLCLVASLGVLFTVPVGSNVAYFTGVLFFLCACRVPAWFAQAAAAAPAWCRRHWIVCGLAVLITLTSVLSGFLKDFARQTAALIRTEARQSAYWDQRDPPQRATPLVIDTMRQSWRSGHTLFGDVQARLDHTPWSEVLGGIAQARAQGAALAVHVPPSNAAFWQRLKGGSPYWCLSAHLTIPADLGVPMLRGIGTRELEKECMPGGQIWYGFGKQQEAHRAVPLDDAKLCTLAQQAGFHRVYVLEDIWIPANNRVLACKPGQNP